jgi:hypothetical protein
VNAHPQPPIPAAGGVLALRYALIPLRGTGIAEQAVARMLDPEGRGTARLSTPTTWARTTRSTTRVRQIW